MGSSGYVIVADLLEEAARATKDASDKCKGAPERLKVGHPKLNFNVLDGLGKNPRTTLLLNCCSQATAGSCVTLHVSASHQSVRVMSPSCRHATEVAGAGLVAGSGTRPPRLGCRRGRRRPSRLRRRGHQCMWDLLHTVAVCMSEMRRNDM